VGEANANMALIPGPLSRAANVQHHPHDAQNDLDGSQRSVMERLLSLQRASAQADLKHLARDSHLLVNQFAVRIGQRVPFMHAVIALARILGGALANEPSQFLLAPSCSL
jgi:hypothetical protein